MREREEGDMKEGILKADGMSEREREGEREGGRQSDRETRRQMK